MSANEAPLPHVETELIRSAIARAASEVSMKFQHVQMHTLMACQVAFGISVS